MSTQYTVAAQLLDGSVLMDQFKSAKLDRDELWQLVEKVDCVWNRDFDKLSPWHTRVTVDFGKGYTVCHEVSGPTTFEDALSNEGIRSKWSMLADRFVLLQPITPFFKPIDSPETLSRDSRESIVLTWRNATAFLAWNERPRLKRSC